MKRLAALLLIAALVVTSACGWRLRGSVSLPEGISAVQLTQADNPVEFRQSLTRLLETNGVTLVETGGEAQLVLNIGALNQRQRVGATGGNTLVTEYELNMEVPFSVQDGQGNTLLPRDTATNIRNYEFDQNDAASMEEEQRLIEREMYRDLAQQIVRRLRFIDMEPASENQ